MSYAYVALTIALTVYGQGVIKWQVLSTGPRGLDGSHDRRAAVVLVLNLSGAFFHEPITIPKVVGLGLMVAGIVVGSQG